MGGGWGIALPTLHRISSNDTFTNSGGPRLDFALEAGYRLAPNWILGGFYVNTTDLEPAVIVKTGKKITTHDFWFLNIVLAGAEGTYLFLDTEPGAAVSLRVAFAGTQFGESEQNQQSHLTYAVGPKFSYDYLMDMGLSIGAEVSGYFIGGNYRELHKIRDEGTPQEEAYTVIEAQSEYALFMSMITLKYWFD